MRIDIERLSDQLADDLTFTDYDFWKALNHVENDLYVAERAGEPVPFRLLQQRRILRVARRKRYGR